MIKIIVDDKIPFISGAFEPVAEVLYLAGAKTTPGDVKTASALVTRTRTKCNSTLLSGSSVKYIASATIGHDHIDADYCQKNEIDWSNVPGCNSGSVQQYVLSVIFNLEKNYGFDLADKTVGVIGVGNVGKKVSAALSALGANVLLNDPPRADLGESGFVSLDELLAKSDIICLHTPLITEGVHPSFHLIDCDQLEKFVQNKSDCFLINAGRGGVVSGDALKLALKSHSNLHAVLDVWEDEPNIDLELLDLVDYGSCHTAGYSSDGKANGTTASVRAISKKFNLGLDQWKAEIPNEVDLDFFYDSSSAVLDNLRRLVLTSFEIGFDDQLLRDDPSKFEYLRGSYRIRREPSIYSIRGCDQDVRSEFSQLISKISY